MKRAEDAADDAADAADEAALDLRRITAALGFDLCAGSVRSSLVS